MPSEGRTSLDPADGFIVVKVFGALSEPFGATSREMPLPAGGTLGDLLRELSSALPEATAKLEQGLEDGYLNVLINGRNARFLDGRRTPLAAGDTVAFLPPVGGG
jgi:MoaD family protein